MLSGLIVFIYGLIILIGGILGYIKAASLASLIMGIVFGSLLIVSSILLFKKKKLAVLSSLSLVLILDAFFTYRFMLTKNFMPAGLLSIVSLITLVGLTLIFKRSGAISKNNYTKSI